MSYITSTWVFFVGFYCTGLAGLHLFTSGLSEKTVLNMYQCELHVVFVGRGPCSSMTLRSKLTINPARPCCFALDSDASSMIAACSTGP